MSLSGRAGMLFIGLVSAGAAQAVCSVSADPGAGARKVSPTGKADAELVVSMSIIPKVAHLDYRASAERPSCDLGPLIVGDGNYELWGSDVGGRQRKALPSKKGQPIALVIPVFDMIRALHNAKAGEPAAIEGYLLATVTRKDLTGWRLYTAMPEVAVLKHDMAEVLAGGASAIFRNEPGGKVTVFTQR